jgi:hypothetical protein
MLVRGGSGFLGNFCYLSGFETYTEALGVYDTETQDVEAANPLSTFLSTR